MPFLLGDGNWVWIGAEVVGRFGHCSMGVGCLMRKEREGEWAQGKICCID
jgi:hypothetical protein